jgi:Flp pilus assembly protein TadD
MNYENVFSNQRTVPLNIIGVEKADVGEIRLAIRYFTEAIELNPDDPKAYFNRATLLVKLGDIKGARADFIIAEKLSS